MNIKCGAGPHTEYGWPHLYKTTPGEGILNGARVYILEIGRPRLNSQRSQVASGGGSSTSTQVSEMNDSNRSTVVE